VALDELARLMQKPGIRGDVQYVAALMRTPAQHPAGQSAPLAERIEQPALNLQAACRMPLCAASFAKSRRTVRSQTCDGFQRAALSSRRLTELVRG